MESITTIAQLKTAILNLEIQKEMKGQILKVRFHQTIEDLKPLNLLKRAIDNMATSPFLIENILGNAVGFVTGFVSKKIVTGTSANIFRKLLGSLVQIGVTNSVKQHPETIISIGQFIFRLLFKPKVMNSTKT